jgi:hypothetical protein
LSDFQGGVGSLRRLAPPFLFPGIIPPEASRNARPGDARITLA